MEHGAKAAQAFSTLIKQTAPKEDQPGKKRSLVIGAAGTGNKPVILVSPKKPTTALAELKKMSTKLGTVTPLAVGEVILEDNVIHVKALKNANEAKVKTVFLDYYRAYKVSPPSTHVKLWQPNEWEAVEFDEDPDDTGAADEDGATDKSDDDGAATKTEAETETETKEDPSAAYQDHIVKTFEQYKKMLAIAGANPKAQPFLKEAEGKLREAHGKFKAADYRAVDAVLEATRELLLAAGKTLQAQAGNNQAQAKPQAPTQQQQAAPTADVQPQAPDGADAIRAAVTQVGTTVLKARGVQTNTPSLQALRQRLDAEWSKLGVATNAKDWATAQTMVNTVGTAARQLLLRQEVDISASQKQAGQQKAQYDEMAPVLGEVTRTYFNPNAAAGSARLRKEDLKAGTHFKAYLAALEALEKLKASAGANPAALKQAADQVAKAAQDHLDHFDRDLKASEKNDKIALRKKQICGEALKAARHYSMALELQGIGAPSMTQPWSQEQQVKVNGLRAQFAFETGYKKASNLGGAGGQSAAYWVESKPLGSKDPIRNFIFKPMEGEETTLRADVKGAGAAKEFIASAKAKLFERQTGIDLGVPETSVATIGTYAIDATGGGSGSKIGSIQQFANTSEDITDQPPGFLAQIDPRECQRLALNDIMALNVDRHAGNFLVEKGTAPNKPPRLVPIDHGCTLPTRKDFKNIASDFGGSNVDGTTKNVLLVTPGSYTKFPQDMQDRIALMDPDAIAAGTKDHLAALDRGNPGLGAAQKVPQESIDLSTRVLKFLKKAAPTLSPAEIQIAIAQNKDVFADFNQDIEQIADQLIRTAAPKGPGYAEFFGFSVDQRTKVIDTLVSNGWGGKGARDINVHAFIMSDPVTALKLYKGNVKKGQADAATAASAIDMTAAHTNSARGLLTDITALLADADPGNVAAFTQRHQQLAAVNPADENQAKDLEDQAKKLYDDVGNSCLGVLAGTGKKLYDDNIGRFPENSGTRRELKNLYAKSFLTSVKVGRSVKGAKSDLDHMRQAIATAPQ